MTFAEVRNTVVEGLEAHIGRPVVLSDQISDMQDFPYCYYSVLAPRVSDHAFGLNEALKARRGTVLRRSEPVKATMSFTFCSQNRKGKHGKYIYGDDDALELAEKAHGFFLLDCHCITTRSGDIVVHQVGSVGGRSGFVVEDTVRRYGFDVQLSYVRTDDMSVETVEKVKIDGRKINSEGG